MIAEPAANTITRPYRGLSVQEVNVPLTPAGIEGLLSHREIYRRTAFLVLRNGPDTALVAVRPADPGPLFSPVAELRVLSGPEATLWITDPPTDVGNATSLAAAARKQQRPGVLAYVVQGKFEHVNFIWRPAPVQIRVTEVIPPHPPKLLAMAEQVVAYDEDLPPIDLILDAVDVTELVAANPAPHYLLPCRGSGMPAEGDVSFLDTHPPYHDDWLLIGCERSRQFHNHFYLTEPRQVDLCPKARVVAGTPGGPVLTKCCLRERGIEVDGTTAVVPWGANLDEVRAALRALCGVPPAVPAAGSTNSARREARQPMSGGAHPADSAIFGHLWTTPEASALFTDEGRTQSWLQILAALAQAQADVGLIPAEAAKTIRAHADVSLIDLDLVAKQTRETGHSTMGLITALRSVLPEDTREWVYYGATVQDLSDTWFALVFRAVGDIAERDVTRMRDRALELAGEYRDTPMCGRTHGQPGLPITFGFKAAVWAAELDRHLERLRQGRHRWEVVQLGGALGTMEFWGGRALDLLDGFARQLRLGVPVVPWLTARDGVAEFIWLLAAISATAGKIGNEVYQLQRPEIGELRESFTPGTVGSITMPHKRNPEISEHLVTLARVIRAQAGVALDGMVSEHERDGRAWKAEWLVVPETSMAFAACVGSGARMLDGIRADPDRMLANIDSHRGYLLSEPVMRALADRLGKHSAHDSVYAAAMHGLDQDQDFRAALRGDPRLDAIPDAELDELLEVRSSLGSCAAFVDRARGR